MQIVDIDRLSHVQSSRVHCKVAETSPTWLKENFYDRGYHRASTLWRSLTPRLAIYHLDFGHCLNRPSKQ